ncbi:DUF5677 domain-containing protein [Bradyrhizobium sp. SZCCHNRI1003]|uniref:DUF5677 domain-containing protein n=1 Tax=Bradyrhizobium sp. SZCCHNRI1003 TaxID=3057275 RepID=UPI002916115E|nr:DUF5677 domain-containing protein [Bradyrhizobium sp. SZCCHNRI1003]
MPDIEKKVALRVTPLEKLKKKGKVLQGPIKDINLQVSAWLEDALPELLWTTLVVTHLPRQEALAFFRRILSKVKEHKAVLEGRRLEHSRLAELDQASFDLFFAEECAAPPAANALAPLLVLDDLPDRAHWSSRLETPSYAEGWNKLAAAIANTFDHQSQAATDCRWFKLMTAVALDKFVFPSKMAERVNEYINYPNLGDMRSVRPSIRAAEMILRPRGPLNEPETEWTAAFWRECWSKTECIPTNPDQTAFQADHKQLRDQAKQLHEELIKHFIETIEQTAIDAKHDSCYGLMLYVLQLLFLVLYRDLGQTTVGRNILRSAVESYITLSFLVHHDNPTVWLQYRNYGAGQLKLALLKRINQEDIPSFMGTELLEQLANEDMWLEFQDIKLGAWADKNLRKMADEAGEKAFYDRYYDALSGYIHANWSAVRHSVFGPCLNPLHRFHRIPLPPRLLMDDVIPDLRKITNLALDRLAHCYPPFKMRLKEQ